MIWSQLFHLEVEGAACTWRIARVSGSERIDGCFHFRVVAEPMDGDLRTSDLDLDALVTQRARLRWPLEPVGERVVEGVVDEVSRSGTSYELAVVARAAVLADGADYHVFLDQDALAIAKAVLAEHGLTLEARVGRALPKREQCVQSFESALSFVSRILAEEGIAWFLPRDRPDVVVATDHGGGFDRIEAPLPIVDAGGFVIGRSAYRVRLERLVVTGKVTLRDYDFLAPQLELKAEAAGARADLESYEFPGGFRDRALGGKLAQLRLEEKRARELVLRAETNARDLAAGCIVELRGEPAKGEWLILEVAHEGLAGARDVARP